MSTLNTISMIMSTNLSVNPKSNLAYCGRCGDVLVRTTFIIYILLKINEPLNC